MGDISFIEWAVYGTIAYSSILMLIISTIKEIPIGKSLSILRSIYLIPGMICAAILAQSGTNIIFNTSRTTIVHMLANGTKPYNDTSTVLTNQIVLQSPVWSMVHMLIFTVLLVYVISQILIFFTRHEKES